MYRKEKVFRTLAGVFFILSGTCIIDAALVKSIYYAIKYGTKVFMYLFMSPVSIAKGSLLILCGLLYIFRKKYLFLAVSCFLFGIYLQTFINVFYIPELRKTVLSETLTCLGLVMMGTFKNTHHSGFRFFVYSEACSLLHAIAGIASTVYLLSIVKEILYASYKIPFLAGMIMIFYELEAANQKEDVFCVTHSEEEKQ